LLLFSGRVMSNVIETIILFSPLFHGSKLITGEMLVTSVVDAVYPVSSLSSRIAQSRTSSCVSRTPAGSSIT
jgi:hypothetical protein